MWGREPEQCPPHRTRRSGAGRMHSGAWQGPRWRLGQPQGHMLGLGPLPAARPPRSVSDRHSVHEEQSGSRWRGSWACGRRSAAPRLCWRWPRAGTQDREGPTRPRPASRRPGVTAAPQRWLEARPLPSHTLQRLVWLLTSRKQAQLGQPHAGAGGGGQVGAGCLHCLTWNCGPLAGSTSAPAPRGPRRPCQSSPDSADRRRGSGRSAIWPGHAEEVSGRGQRQQDQTGPRGWPGV